MSKRPRAGAPVRVAQNGRAYTEARPSDVHTPAQTPVRQAGSRTEEPAGDCTHHPVKLSGCLVEAEFLRHYGRELGAAMWDFALPGELSAATLKYTAVVGPRKTSPRRPKCRSGVLPPAARRTRDD